MPTISLADSTIYINNAGKPTDGEKLRADLLTLIGESNNQDTRLTNLEANAMTIGGQKTFSVDPQVTGASARLILGSGTASASLVSAGLFVSSDANKPGIRFAPTKWEATLDGTNFYQLLTPLQLPAIYHVQNPVYLTATTFRIGRFTVTDLAGTFVMSSTSATTLDVATTGLSGIAQSANLTGTASCSGTTVTGVGTTFTTDFQAGDVIWFSGGAARRITNVGGNTSMTVESSLTQGSTTYRRGGRAPSTWYNVYATTNGTASGLILSTRNVAAGDTLVDLPSGYTTSRQIRFAARLDASSNLLAWHPIGTDGLVQWVAAINALSSGTASSYTSVSLAASVPPISRRAYLSGRYQKTTNATSSGSESLFVRMGGGTTDDWRVFNYTSSGLGTNAGAFGLVPTSTAQAIEYYRTNAQGGTTVVDIDVYGYYVTEVV